MESIAVQENRCFGRAKAHELTSEEIDSVAGGTSYTGITLDHIDENGDPVYDYGDIGPDGPFG